MADISTLLETAIYNVAVANSALWNSVDGRMKHGRAVAGWSTPYVLYSFPNLPSTNVYKESSPRVFSVSIYFDVFSSDDYSAAEAGAIAGYIRTAFDGASLSLTGFNDTTVKMVNGRPAEQEETGLWHIQLQYSGMACVA